MTFLQQSEKNYVALFFKIFQKEAYRLKRKSTYIFMGNDLTPPKQLVNE